MKEKVTEIFAQLAANVNETCETVPLVKIHKAMKETVAILKESALPDGQVAVDKRRLDMLLAKVNGVTCYYRHHKEFREDRMIDLCNEQITFEDSYYHRTDKHGEDGDAN